MAPLHVAPLTVKRELPIGSLPYLSTKDKLWLHVAPLTVNRELPKYLSRVSTLPLYQG